MPKQPWEPLANYQLFPTFATQADADAAKAPGAKNYAPGDDTKGWHDPDADKPGGGKLHFEVNGIPHVFYPFVFRGKTNPDATQDPATQFGLLESLVIPVEVAKRVNIKPSGLGMTNIPGTDRTIPVPLAPLGEFQRIMAFGGPGSIVMKVRNLDVPLPTEATAANTEAVLVAVQAIGAAVQVIGVKVDKLLVKFAIT